ncbi:STM3941 family protein [Anaerosporobacter sp.]|uniref:STM3941 family protein n=1 Tax=Anaerosporobacter sp. TaxID=1872529 RepID=UPI00286EFDDB|nr:STM3941 family protein [Anaerosporobacter sp.]
MYNNSQLVEELGSAGEEMNRLTIYENKKQAHKLLGQACFMTVASGILLYMGIVDENTLFDIMGGVGSFFFGLCTLVQFGRVIKRKPLFVIQENGIEDTSTSTSVGFIAYEDIQEIVMGKTLGKESIGIYLTDVNALLETLPQVKQKAIQSNLANKFPPVLLRVDSVEGKTGRDVYVELQRTYEEYMGNQGVRQCDASSDTP